jgi:hypothetical protein
MELIMMLLKRINEMVKLPKDILNRIEKDYKAKHKQKYVIEKLSTLYCTYINVGVDQLIRSILILADGKAEEIDKIFESNFYGDPRDLIMNAMSKTNNETHYGINPFK